jgi:hypothetical protein
MVSSSPSTIAVATQIPGLRVVRLGLEQMEARAAHGGLELWLVAE